ncbi:cytochrome c oxidase subunit II [Xylophilus sp.]|uniref:cytochrome c oxidase subunit II n=1 Tax=Xylophilus sp. TaxID=2653893 RepID=UPI0013BE5B69|nr:cytochrome c oxidase subunit II [Xylophilus sp.]KAF1047442.1 MAG: cytochrome c oxidase subunit 2 [Xylophilus sp.]
MQQADTRWTRPRLLAAVAAAAAAPAWDQVLQPAGPQAAHIVRLWNLTLVVCTAVFAVVLAALLLALWRGRSAQQPAGPAAEGAARRWVGGAAGLSALLLAGLVAADVLTDRALSRLPADDALHIEMTGQQWWWESRYAADADGPGFRTAGELHVPVGRTVVVTLLSADVIHTFWVPSLHGKKDMLPGRPTTITLRADQPGRFRGQCAEFCGTQHALMAFGLVADTPERYALWRAEQQAIAEIPRTAAAQRGQALFLNGACAGCHTVRGTPADGMLGPDLTHLASRPAIAAGSAPNTAEALARWVRDPQQIKSGAAMPPSALTDADLADLVAYLRSLG